MNEALAKIPPTLAGTHVRLEPLTLAHAHGLYNRGRHAPDWAYLPRPCFVDLADTISGFKRLVAGEFDHLPEPAFYMVGTIEAAVEKAKKLAAEAA